MEMCSIISIKSKNVYSMSRPPVTSMPEIRWIFHGYYEIFESQTAGHKCATSLCWCLVQENKIDSGKTRRETLTKGISKSELKIIATTKCRLILEQIYHRPHHNKCISFLRGLLCGCPISLWTIVLLTSAKLPNEANMKYNSNIYLYWIQIPILIEYLISDFGLSISFWFIELVRNILLKIYGDRSN